MTILFLFFTLGSLVVWYYWKVEIAKIFHKQPTTN